MAQLTLALFLLVIVFSWTNLATCNSAEKHKDKEKGSREDQDGTSCTTANNEPGVCKPFSQCVNLYADYDKYIKHVCNLPTGGERICCPTKIKNECDPNEELPTPIKVYETPQSGTAVEISENDIEEARKKAKEKFKKRIRIEEELIKRNLTVKKGSTTAFHQGITNTFDETLKLTDAIENIVSTARNLISSLKLNPKESLSGIYEILRKNNKEETTPCSDEGEPCEESEYRTADGSCNNLKHRNWGKSFTPFIRIAQPDYCDDIGTPRCAYDKRPLKSPRIISYTVLTDLDKPHKRITNFLASFGQFIDHDMTLTPIAKAIGNVGITCCDPEIQADPENLLHPECYAIDVPADDPDYSEFGITCMEFVRSMRAPITCNFGPREQLNQVTACIDGSMIYASTGNETQSLRSKQDGKLLSEDCNGQQYLPFNTPDQTCTRPDVNFRAGDVRVNEIPQLTLYQTVFMRLHNRVVEILKELNPHWDDEKLFQEGRRFVGAVLQQLVQMEFLPLILGVKMMKKFDLLPKEKGYSHDYDPSVVLAVINEAAAAGYRLHDIVYQFEVFLDKDGEQTEVPLKESFGLPTNITKEGNFENLIRGGTNEETQDFDQYMTKQLTNHLFQFGGPIGLDLASLNINRGRDHGLRPYNDIRKICGLSEIKSFEDLHKNHRGDSGARIAKVFSSPEDIDLWIGGTTEKPMCEAVVGPTFGCLIGELFRNLKLGDRFWYENGGQKNSFSECQLESIRQMSLARILCDNSEIGEIQPLPFVKSDKKFNKIISCQDPTIPLMDLSCWKEEQ